MRSVTNLLKVKDSITSFDVQKAITNAFQRSATIDADKIKAQVMGSRVILSGTVRSLSEKEDAENAVWFAKGVTSVDNKLIIEEPEYSFEMKRQLIFQLFIKWQKKFVEIFSLITSIL